MDHLQRLLIERECERLVTRYCHHVDHGEAAKVADLFSSDGVWTGPGVRIEGQEQANAARMSRHICNNLLLEVIDDSHAEGIVYLTLYRHDGEEGRKVSPLEGPALVGEYRDRFVRTTEGWRFEERRILVNFVREEASGD